MRLISFFKSFIWRLSASISSKRVAILFSLTLIPFQFSTCLADKTTVAEFQENKATILKEIKITTL
jgi:hypothetical protein